MQVTTLSKISQGTLGTDPNLVALSQTTSIKGSSLQVGLLVDSLLRICYLVIFC